MTQEPSPDREEADKRCLVCHGRAHIAELNPAERRSMVGTWIENEPIPEEIIPAADVELSGTEPEFRPGLYVTPESLTGSVHEGLACIDCHEDAERLPHAPTLNLQTCGAACHEYASSRYAAGTHSAHHESSDVIKSPGCSTCHGGHDILPVASKDSPTHPLNMVHICADCHDLQPGPTSNGNGHQERVAMYVDSIHGQAVLKGGLISAATCAACHENHRVLPATDARSSVNRVNIPETCGQCHQGIVKIYATSIHGDLFAQGDDRAPSCVDCHATHGITETDKTEFMLDVVNECGDCHNRESMARGFRSTFYETYRASYHGQVTKLGSVRAARCSDCHGSHDILPMDHPDSRVNDENCIETCRTCHPDAGKMFAQYDPHADYRDHERYPLLFGIWIYFIIVMSSAFGFFGLHTVLWFGRTILDRIRIGPVKKHFNGSNATLRFSVLNRINHALAALTFFGLTATGIPLLFSSHAWAQPLANLFGGVIAAGLWHRIFAFVLIVNSVVFLGGIVHSAVHRKGTFLRGWLFGPNSLMPRWKDLSDCAGMFRWFFVGGEKPRFDRWTYWEKFDFWCEIGGSCIIGGSGLLLWFPDLASWLLPGWVFNAAMVVHGYEALLAIGFIFTIHFFNANLRMEKFPVDDVIFTGQLPEEELREERPLEYERLKKSGELETIRVEPSPHWKHVCSTIVGLTLMAIGLILITLILLAGFNMI